MAQRRMFSKRIVESARFLKMPPSTQALYFHLGLHADDDGVVEGYNVMLQTGSTEDDLKILTAKGFVTVLNDDLVTYINDWRENNRIRADRKIDSIYKDLLIKMIPDVKIQHAKARADTGKKTGAKALKDNGRPVNNPRTTNGPHRLGQVRSGQASLGKDRSSSSIVPSREIPVEKDEEDDRKNKLLAEIKRVATEPTESEWSSVVTLANGLSWQALRLVVMDFVVKMQDQKVERPYPYLLTVMRERVKEAQHA